MPTLTTLFIGVYTLSAAVMALHFEVLTEGQGGCPVPMLVGEPETGIGFLYMQLIYLTAC